MAEKFQFDTSGEIVLPYPMLHPHPRGMMWPDLPLGVQGCIAGMLEEAAKYGSRLLTPDQFSDRCFVPLGFSDLHPDTLARIIADWEAYASSLGIPSSGDILDTLAGAAFWRERQAGARSPPFPPLTPYLDDAGKVCLREVA